jgi:hypothetical protein
MNLNEEPAEDVAACINLMLSHSAASENNSLTSSLMEELKEAIAGSLDDIEEAVSMDRVPVLL